MNRSRQEMIASLTEELAPVRAFNPRDGALMVALAGALSVIGVIVFEGFWHGILAGEAAPFFWVTSGLLLVLGLAATSAVIMMASPRVGNRHDAPKWASATLAVLPIAAVISIIPHAHEEHLEINSLFAVHCIQSSLVASLATGAALTLWLRRGAPVSLNLAGWFTGLAAGALGTAAYGLSCPVDTVTHLGISHVVPVVVMAILGRLAVPPLVRW
ncbi:NrsF family protein [Altererythrobacter sp. GH1-8]|uniref:NrsF family protein n=1 Tax=Altererythrobacter sp. GH1-8 TaxID=3349333 RepID=UPI00374D7E01